MLRESAAIQFHYLLTSEPREWNDIPRIRLREIVCNYLCASTLHVKAKESARRSYLKHAFPFEFHMAQINFNAVSEIPFSLGESESRNFRRMMKLAILDLVQHKLDSASLGYRQHKTGGEHDDRYEFVRHTSSRFDLLGC